MICHQSEVAQSCPTLCDPMDCSLPGSSVHGIFQARILEWVAISFSGTGSFLLEPSGQGAEQNWLAEGETGGTNKPRDVGHQKTPSRSGLSSLLLLPGETTLALWADAVFSGTPKCLAPFIPPSPRSVSPGGSPSFAAQQTSTGARY